MAEWQVVVTDLNGAARAFVTEYDSIEITPRLNGWRSVAFVADPLQDAAAELLVGERALRIYDDVGVLRFNGKIWEPLTRTASGITVAGRGPYAELASRRIRDEATATYAAQDAGLILFDRISRQNGYRNSYLRAGTRQASSSFARTYGVAQRESEVFDDLAGSAGGPFFLEQPVDGVAGVFADLNVLYPNAGGSLEGVRFEYGDGTLDNLVDFEIVETLPLTRATASSSGSGGGRIAATAEDATAVTRFGLFEDETSYSDQADAAMLQQQAQSMLRLDVGRVLGLTPGGDAPGLFVDFNVGDFVRAKIVYGAINFWGWVRITEATLTVDKDGNRNLSNLTVEIVASGQPTIHPDELFAYELDSTRRRLEALERKVQNITASTTVPPAAPAPSAASQDAVPAEPAAPAAAPPASAPPAPTLANLTAVGTRTDTVLVDVDVNGQGAATTVTVVIGPRTVAVDAGKNGTHLQIKVDGLARNTAYTATVTAQSSSGTTTTTTPASTLDVNP